MEGKDTLIQISYDLDGNMITASFHSDLEDIKSIIRWFSNLKGSKDIYVKTVFFRGFTRNWNALCREAFY